MRFSSFFCLFLLACGGATNEPSGPTGGNPTETPATTTSANAPAQTPAASTSQNDAPKVDCPSPASVIAKSGTTIRQPVGKVQRFQLTYQGSDIGVAALRGVDMIISGSDGPFTPGYNAGYWAEVRDASGKTTFTRLLQDPTRLEAPGPNGTFTNGTVDQCIAKTMLVDVPRAPTGSVLVIFGMGYGNQKGASELGRFTLE